MEVTFWGVRGSVPCAASSYQKYGGHTSCVSVEVGGEIIIFDAGSGISDAGKYILTKGYRETHLFLSHYHLDHIMGFPFFAPIWRDDSIVNVYSHASSYGGTRETLFNAFQEPIFPVPFAILPAKLAYHDLRENDLTARPSFQVRNGPLNHPNGSTGYRIEAEGKALCYITDNEHDHGAHDEWLQRFIYGADLVVYDASYTEEEYSQRKNWGHSTWVDGMRICQGASVKTFCLFHHDHHHTDEMMAEIEKQAKDRWSNIIVARQGMKVIL